MKKRLAWIGTGVMGYPMVNHLSAAGYTCRVYNRSLEKTQGIQAEVCLSIKEVVQDADVIFTMVGYPKDVESTYAEIFAYAPKGALCIDMTTSDPNLAKRLSLEAKQKGLRLLDAPVSGGDSGARNATLTIMVGGDERDFIEAKPLFEHLGKSITHIGPAGSGQHCKMANQIVVAGNLAAVAEAIRYAQRVGLDPQQMIETIQGGAASSWQLINNGPKMIKQDYAPGFYIHHFIKDLTLVQATMAPQKAPIADYVLDQLKKQVEHQPEDAYLGTQAFIKGFNETE